MIIFTVAPSHRSPIAALPDLATSAEVARLVGKTPKTVERWAREGKIPAFKTGDSWLFARPAVAFWDALRSERADRLTAELVFLNDLQGLFETNSARMSPDEGAQVLRLTTRTFLDQCRAGTAPAVDKRGAWFVDTQQLRDEVFESVYRWLRGIATQHRSASRALARP